MHSFNIFGACSLAASSCLRSAHDFHSNIPMDLGKTTQTNPSEFLAAGWNRCSEFKVTLYGKCWHQGSGWSTRKINGAKLLSSSDGKCLGRRPSCYFRCGQQMCPSAWLELTGPPDLLGWEETTKTGPLIPKWWLLYYNETSVSTIWHHLPPLCFQTGDVTLMNSYLTAIYKCKVKPYAKEEEAQRLQEMKQSKMDYLSLTL